MRPQPARHAPAGLHLVEDQRHVVDARQQPQLAHEARAGHPYAAFTLDRLDENGRHAPRPSNDIGRQVGVLRHDECVHILIGMHQELVDRLHLATERILAFLRVRQASGHEQVPQLLEAALFSP